VFAFFERLVDFIRLPTGQPPQGFCQFISCFTRGRCSSILIVLWSGAASADRNHVLRLSVSYRLAFGGGRWPFLTIMPRCLPRFILVGYLRTRQTDNFLVT
jgi:hypothetical protein